MCLQFLIASYVLRNQEIKDFVAIQAGVGNLQFILEMGQNRMDWDCEDGGRWQDISEELFCPVKTSVVFFLYFRTFFFFFSSI